MELAWKAGGTSNKGCLETLIVHGKIATLFGIVYKQGFAIGLQ